MVSSLYWFYCENCCDTTSFQMSRKPLPRVLKSIKWFCIRRIVVVSWQAIIKCVFWCLDKQWYNCFHVYIIAYNIPSVFPIVVWYFIRDHNFHRRKFSYLSLYVKILRSNPYLQKLKTRHLYYLFLNPSYKFLNLTYQIAEKQLFNLFTFTKQKFTWSFYFLSLSYSNLATLWDANPWVLTLFYLYFLGIELFIIIAPRNQLIIVIKVFISHFLKFYKQIREILQRVRVFTHWSITLVLWFKVIRDIE